MEYFSYLCRTARSVFVLRLCQRSESARPLPLRQPRFRPRYAPVGSASGASSAMSRMLPFDQLFRSFNLTFRLFAEVNSGACANKSEGDEPVC